MAKRNFYELAFLVPLDEIDKEIHEKLDAIVAVAESAKLRVIRSHFSTCGKSKPMSATAVRSEYAALLSSALPAVIRSEAENERCIRRLEELDSKGKPMTAAERRMADFSLC